MAIRSSVRVHTSTVATTPSRRTSPTARTPRHDHSNTRLHTAISTDAVRVPREPLSALRRRVTSRVFLDDDHARAARAAQVRTLPEAATAAASGVGGGRDAVAVVVARLRSCPSSAITRCPCPALTTQASVPSANGKGRGVQHMRLNGRVDAMRVSFYGHPFPFPVPEAPVPPTKLMVRTSASPPIPPAAPAPNPVPPVAFVPPGKTIGSK